MSVRLLSYNIKRGGAGREAALAAVIRSANPDLVVLQEATNPRVVAELASATGLSRWACQPRFSLAFMSRVDVAHHAWHRPRLSRHAFVEVVLAGSEFRVFGVHLSAVHAAWTERRRVMELRSLLAAITQHEQGCHVLTGDFNTLAPGELLDIRRLPFRLRPFVWLSGGRIRWQTVAVVLEAQYIDGYRALHPEDPGYTFPTWDPHIRLDYVFVPAAHRERLTRCEIVSHPDTGKASDHLPVVAELQREY